MNKNKTSKIEIRVDSKTKEMFAQYAKDNNTTVSTLLRNYIKEIMENGKEN